MKKQIDWQGHRGARGLAPENSIPSFLKALEYDDVTTLELDLAVSRDEILIVSHEPWMSHHICTTPEGTPVTEELEDSLLLYQMSYEEIKQFDCGSRGNQVYPEQQKMKVYKPSLADVVKMVETHCKAQNRTKPNYNIEIKSDPKYDGIKTPGPKRFVELVLAELDNLDIRDRSNLQSFDFRVVREVKNQDPTMPQALLIMNQKTVQENLEELGFTPEIYSPYFKILTVEIVQDIHKRGMKVIPWTVNDLSSMKSLLEMGVDGIITDYPNLIREAKIN